ncbi:MAG: HNH endonuclease signature motif containing protein [Sediminibacterium sp.]
MIRIPKEKIIEVSNRHKSMTAAAAELNISFGTFKRLAKQYGCFNPNPSGKGLAKPKRENGKSIFKLQDILEGRHPQYQSFKLKLRLFKEGVKEEKCEQCGIKEWNGKWFPLELEHKDGNKYNNRLDNLLILCPNCHSQTDTYRAKNIK